MTRQYSLKSFLRQAPNALLRRYLANQAVGLEVPWESLRETSIEPMVRAIEAADEQVRRRSECDFLEILGIV